MVDIVIDHGKRTHNTTMSWAETKKMVTSESPSEKVAEKKMEKKEAKKRQAVASELQQTKASTDYG